MSAPDHEPPKKSLLFPDPIIEFYMEKIDRAAIRERLRMTTEERLDALMKQQAAVAAEELARGQEEPPNESVSSANFAGFPTYTPEPDPAKRPLLFPDPVVEAYLKDVDRSLLRENLKLSVTERLDSFAAFMRGVYETRGACLASPARLWEEHISHRAGTIRQD